jgi:hypothetical protein
LAKSGALYPNDSYRTIGRSLEILLPFRFLYKSGVKALIFCTAYEVAFAVFAGYTPSLRSGLNASIAAYAFCALKMYAYH